MWFKKLLAVALALVMVLGVLTACGKSNETPAASNNNQGGNQGGNQQGGNEQQGPVLTLADVPRPSAPAIPTIANPTSLNETRTLLVQENTFDGVYNPFFYSSAYDGDVVSFCNVGLVQLDATGAVVAGNQYDTYGLSYEIWYTDNLDTLAKKDTYEEGDYVVYEVVLKNGAFFSDGTLMTADDVLFNYYVYLDPKYDGSSTLYTLPILGLNDYRTQVPGYDAIAAAAKAALAMGPEYTASTVVTQEQHAFYWATMATQLQAFAQSIVDYVIGTTGYVAKYVKAEWTDPAALSAGQKVAAGIAGWGFGSITGDTLTTASGKTFTDMNTLTIDDYVFELVDAYVSGDDYAAEYANLDDTEQASVALLAPVENAFVGHFGQNTLVSSIAGLRKGVKGVVENGKTVAHETFVMILTEQNPKAVLDLGVTVAPKAYYTAGYEYKQDSVVSYGVELNSEDFIAHLKTLNSAPAGAGVYKFVSANEDGVTMVRNDYHFTLGDDTVTNAIIKNIYLKVVDSGKEFEALTAGDVDYANPSANGDVMDDLAKPENEAYTSILVDNLGYGYICINPAAEHLDNIHTRIALTSVFNLEDVKLYYPSGLADVIYRSMSQVSWAYPENAQAIYPYDATLATAIRELKLAGYTYDEGTGRFTDVPRLTFTIPSAAEDHPAGSVFINAQARLATIGVEVEIKSDSNLIANIKKGAVAVYALAWQASADPDMYQVYHYMSSAESVKSNGIKYLQENGTSADLGTIEVTKLDGTTETMTQAEALTYLAELIEEGLKYMSVEERAPIYQKALEVLAQLNIELPTYQRKNMFAYNNTVIDGTTLSATVTPYWGPIAQVWKLSYVNGDATPAA